MNSVIDDGDERGGRRPAASPRRAGNRLALGVCLAALWAGACAVTPGAAPEGPSAPGGPADRVIADEFSDVFANALEPRGTTVQVPAGDDDPSIARLVDALAGRGFGIQRVAADQGAHFLELERGEDALGDGTTWLLWRATIGPVEVRREYALGADGALSTAGPIRLSGARADISPDDLERAGPLVADPAHRRVEYVAPDALERPAPVISLITPELVESVARDATRVRRGGRLLPGPSAQALNAERVETGNLFYGGESNFGSIFDGRDRVARRVVVFPNDSLLLGPDNRRMIAEFVEGAVDRDDVISLVGCSNGPTASPLGNEGLALGRAKRVSDELTTHGVGPERIYDEGCWAPVSAGDRFPGRGVVIELWRAPA